MTCPKKAGEKNHEPVILIRQPTEKNKRSCSFNELQRSLVAFGSSG
jgi:hypothetical protein